MERNDKGCNLEDHRKPGRRMIPLAHLAYFDRLQTTFLHMKQTVDRLSCGMQITLNPFEGFGGRYLMDDANVPVSYVGTSLIPILRKIFSPYYLFHISDSWIRRTLPISRLASCLCLRGTPTFPQARPSMVLGTTPLLA